jgi:hypothetical protein
MVLLLRKENFHEAFFVYQLVDAIGYQDLDFCGVKLLHSEMSLTVGIRLLHP